MIIATPKKVFLGWGNVGSPPLQNGNYPLFHHYNVWRKSTQDEVFVGSTAAMAFLDEHVTPGMNHVYRVEGVRVNTSTQAVVSKVNVLGPTAVAVPSVTNEKDKQTTCKPLTYKIKGGSKKLKHSWNQSADTQSGLLGVFVEDRADGHAKAFIPASAGGKWDEKIPDRGEHPSRLRSIDRALNFSKHTDWVIGKAGGTRECVKGGSYGSDITLLFGVVYTQTTIANNFAARTAVTTLGVNVGVLATIGAGVTTGPGVTIGDLAQIAAGQTIPANTVIPYNGRVP